MQTRQNGLVWRAFVYAAAVAMFAACRPAVEMAPRTTPSCSVGDAVPTTGDTLRIAVSERIVAPGSTIPVSDDAMLIHRQLYEALVEVDCQGKLSPGLASAWESHFGGREWRFALRPGASYWDGVSVSLVDIIESWERNWPSIDSLVPPGEYFNVADAIAYDRLVIRLEEPDSLLPMRLARLEFAVRRPMDADGAWPVGTGWYRPSAAGTRPDGSLTLEPLESNRPLLRFQPIGAGDARDAIDAGLDVVIARGRDVVEYVRRRGDYADYPLGWDATYALLTALDLADEPLQEVRARLRSDIARDAVRVDARPSQCEPVRQSTMLPGESRGDLLYEAGDSTARAIAERLVAIASDTAAARAIGIGGVRRMVAADPADLVSRIQSGGVAGAIYQYSSSGRCDVTGAVARSLGDTTVMPLLDVRRHMFVASGKVRARIGADGIPRLFPRVRPALP